jgi:hypothetical protein
VGLIVDVAVTTAVSDTPCIAVSGMATVIVTLSERPEPSPARLYVDNVGVHTPLAAKATVSL